MKMLRGERVDRLSGERLDKSINSPVNTSNTIKEFKSNYYSLNVNKDRALVMSQWTLKYSFFLICKISTYLSFIL